MEAIVGGGRAIGTLHQLDPLMAVVGSYSPAIQGS
jgi:hypothetical protein